MFSFSRQSSQRPQGQRKLAKRSLSFQQLEDRSVLSGFAVVNLNDQGAGSLRQAILNADSTPGADTIDFNVAGTITLTSGALPTITGAVDIDGTSAPGFAGTPVVEIDFNGFAGLTFNAASAGSTLNSLSLVDASGAGVTLNGGGHTTVVGNYIGLGLDGATADGNHGDGLAINASTGNIIGGTSAGQGNVISANGGNGIGLYGASNNQIQTNSIGTDATGTLNLGNTGDGILVTTASKGNLIGGSETGGNDPTNNVFVRPPEGNLISGNGANGVLLTGGATQNTLSGNYIGTNAAGTSALGNVLDGVAIVNANDNSLIGCTATQDPFVYYNVISGNGGNGIRVTNSNDTTIQANFIGLGSDNLTPVGNALNGVLVEGTSTRTTMGGPIPLGNVDAANGESGILVQGTASYFTSYNTFCGLAAFETYTNLGNHGDGMLITSTGSNILIRTNVITENGNDGVEISGSASGVRVAGNIIGQDTSGNIAMGNVNNGVEVDGNAHNDIIGGPQPTFNIIPQNDISSNGTNGVEIDGTAHNIIVSHSYIGTALSGQNAFGNGGAGVLLGPGTYSDTIGSTDPTLTTIIANNLGDGIDMNGTHGNTVEGTFIGTDATGLVSMGNAGSGIVITNSSNNVIGSASTWPLSIRSLISTSSAAPGSPANVIAFNSADGVDVASGNSNSIGGNSIHDNTGLGIDLAAGANMNQAAPVLTSLQTVSGGIQVAGSLTGTPKTTFMVQFFANYTSGTSGNVYLGSIPVTTSAAGVATFLYKGPALPTGASFVSATATDPAGNTSEFGLLPS